MKVLLVPFGTAGDVHPLIGLGLELKDRGHRVAAIVNPFFERLARENEFDFEPVGTYEEFAELLKDPRLWHPLHGARILARYVSEYVPLQHRAIVKHHEPGDTVVIASGGSFGARVAQEHLGFPLVTVALQPALFRSYHHLPVLAGFPHIPDRLPRFFKSLIFKTFDVLADRSLFGARINAYRGSLGLPPVRAFMKDWWLSPDLVLALFPEWYVAKQPDWPTQMLMTGFPLYDERRRHETLAPELESWLAAGDPPIVFTPGSAMVHGHEFFQAGADACVRLGRRGLFLTRFPEQLPRPLPSLVRHESYVPFSQLLLKAAAIVYHGGIGTMSQAMAAGIPHLLMPMAHDQPDNAFRIRQMEIGDALWPRAFRGPAVAEKLKKLLHSTVVAENCQRVAARFNGVNSISASCDLIEELADRRSDGGAANRKKVAAAV